MNQAIKRIRVFTPRRLIITVISFSVLAGVAIFMLATHWPYTRQSIIDALQEQSARTVEIQAFRQTYFPPGCVADGVQFLHRVHKNKPPLITIRKLVIRGSYLGLLRFPIWIDKVLVIGLHMSIPSRTPGGERSDVSPLTASKSGKSVLISQMTADDAVLEFQPAKPGEDPFVVRIRRLALAHIGSKDRFSFRTVLSISKPPGEVRAAGTFGPWNEQDPGRTAASGDYTYNNADLGVFRGIAGTLSSKGKFTGTLGRLQTDGETDLPNLHVDDASHNVPLTTEFHAIVNCTNGDTYLQSVNARFWQTSATLAGAVAGKEGETGKTVAVDFSTNRGRIEDLFRIFVRAKQAPISGSVNLRAKVQVRPGPQPFLLKLRMQGDFGIRDGEFRNADTQASINHLGESGRGESKKQQDDDPGTVMSNLTGHAVVEDGIVTFTNLSFRIPGGLAQVYGTFGLISKKVDLHGVLRTTGAPADATTGFKSLLLKVITPFLKKKRSLTVVPFKITGTYDHVSVGLDFGAKDSATSAAR